LEVVAELAAAVVVDMARVLLQRCRAMQRACRQRPTPGKHKSSDRLD
jgi:hypothetical protein